MPPPTVFAAAAAAAALAPKVAESYNPSIGMRMAYVEKAVYCGRESFEAWDVGDSCTLGPQVNSSQLRFVTNDHTQAAAGVGKMLEPTGCFVGVRGTQGDISSLLDATFWSPFGRSSCDGCQVDFGFKTAYESIADGVFQALADFGCQEVPLYLVGHSQGAAVLHFMLYDAIEKHFQVEMMYALEAPRPGNSAFGNALRSVAKDVDAWRVAHYQDVVVHLPPQELFAYSHALPEIYYTAESGTEYKECGVEDTSCSGQWWPWQWSTKDHTWYADINPCTCAKQSSTLHLSEFVV
eukprot:CAMPEP_0178404350 /NCGR_PEP_ID=MMETSP0689_2-20121128/17837_1 /TAXON_ID=160604 /ORGANISM="Amphidinium massartii, Strain CS-259" /LENGTH=293 /DNA_ID=CAMNT_0020025329 /DNA_START=1 /DNA_END=883 /DNA_ORIENTATION=+